MPAKLQVALDVGTREQRDAITFHLNAKGWKLWHWYQDLWLLAEVPDEVTPRRLWEELRALPPLSQKSVLVMGLDGTPSYYGNAPRDSWDWMADYWGAADDLTTPPPALAR
jgi:hypothetical protein